MPALGKISLHHADEEGYDSGLRFSSGNDNFRVHRDTINANVSTPTNVAPVNAVRSLELYRGYAVKPPKVRWCPPQSPIRDYLA